MGLTLDVGSVAPDFELPDSKDTVKLSDFKGKKNVVLFFYPKSFTAGCTRENRSFAQNYSQFTSLDTEVIGVSDDKVETQDKFSCDLNLPFILLSDKGSNTSKLFEVGKNLFGLIPGRVTFVIDKEGKIVARHQNALNMEYHITESLKTLRSMSAAETKTETKTETETETKTETETETKTESETKE